MSVVPWQAASYGRSRGCTTSTCTCTAIVHKCTQVVAGCRIGHLPTLAFAALVLDLGASYLRPGWGGTQRTPSCCLASPHRKTPLQPSPSYPVDVPAWKCPPPPPTLPMSCNGMPPVCMQAYWQAKSLYQAKPHVSLPPLPGPAQAPSPPPPASAPGRDGKPRMPHSRHRSSSGTKPAPSSPTVTAPACRMETGSATASAAAAAGGRPGGPSTESTPSLERPVPRPPARRRGWWWYGGCWVGLGGGGRGRGRG